MGDNNDPQPSSTIDNRASSSSPENPNVDEVSNIVIELAKARTATAEAQAKLAEVTSAATQVLAIKTRVEDLQAVIAAKSEHIEGAQTHAARVRGDLDRQLTAATQQATDAEGLKARAQAAADDAAELLADLRTTKGTTDTDAEAVSAALKKAEESAAKAKGLGDKSATVEARIADYENRLAELENQGKTRLKTIEGLLPGAASTGLAYGFAERRETFLKPRRNWEKVYFWSLIGITVIAIANWYSFHDAAHTWSDSMLLWLTRLPMAAPLILLAYHAAHEAALGKRLEEAYGYKVAVASSFMGFSKQLSEVGTEKAANALATLYDNTLATIADPPGKIYDKHKLFVTPGDLVTQVAKTVKETIEPYFPGKSS